MKITGNSSQIHVEINGKTLSIEGELTTTPAFYANPNSIKSWEPPHQNEIISQHERLELIKAIIDESNKPGKVPIFFE